MIKDDLNRQLNTQKKNEWDKFKAKEKDYDLLYEECKKDLIEVGIEDDLRSISEWYSEQTGELFKCETKIDEKSFMYIIRKRNRYLEKHPFIKAFVRFFAEGKWDEVLVIDARPERTDDMPKRRHHFRLYYQDTYGNNNYEDEYREMIKYIKQVVVDKIHDQEGRMS